MSILRIKQVDLLEAAEPMIVHGCNAKGAMGSGVAKAIRKKWPEAYDAYRAQLKDKGLRLGDVIFADVAGGKIIANAITQETHGRSRNRRYVSYDAVSDCMTSVRETADKLSVSTVAMPRIGAGLANGNWDIICRIVECELVENGVGVVVYEQ